MTAAFRLGIVGAGYIAGVVARAMRDVPNGQVTAVASRRRESADEFAAEYSVENVFNTWQELVASDAVDAVYVATPTDVREEVAVAAAQHGKHVLGDKPFANLDSLQRIIAACRANGVAFMDATHFTHHPRTAQIRRELAERVGTVGGIRSAFFFPNDDRSNIRYNPVKEPTGAFGDMVWYNMRAIVEYTPDDAELVDSSGYFQRDAVTGAVVRLSGVLRLSNGCLSTWDAGYTVGNLVMDLNLMGERGVISMDDYILDWETIPPLPTPGYPVSFTQRKGVANPQGYTQIPTPSARSQSTLMMINFAAICGNPTGDAAEASIRRAERTQGLLDSVWPTLKEIN
ncbi:MAG: Gfo/Idh/MocA family oxidoreductase [Anaerolineae bacterium]|nr:Gfo/Idh/MocA family oxidoreductase [Anaerolineae bacterium]